MSRQDKATTERHARTLRELVKRPENKVCADCKRNDPRWASWNIGVFVCIRCSGIHRSMGTHISKVKSVDLDTWTPEQMTSVMKWGNSRANAYWEAHLKAGHIPPEHKIESFIRSKYESKRWALEGPVPDDPSVFDNEEGNAAPVAVQEAAPASTSIPPTRPNAVTPAQAAAPVRTSGVTSAQPQGRQLLSSTVAGRAAVPAQAPAAAVHAPAAPAPQDDLFTLDFHAPPTSPTNGSVNNGSQKKDVKQDILSLFSAGPATSAPGSTSFGAFGGAPIQTGAQMSGAQASPWDSFGAGSAQQSQPAQPQSFMGTTGAGMWGASSGWNAPAAPAQPNVWASTSAAPTQAQQQNSLFNTSSVWGVTPSGGAPGPGPAADPFASFGTSTITTQKKDDAFGDIWGSFK